MALTILLAGESWTSHTIHVKGFDTFTTSKYEEGAKWLREAFENNGHTCVYLPGQNVSEDFPFTMEELRSYDLVIISDVGANTFLLPSKTFAQSQATPNRLNLLRDYVREGGALLMVGGYLTFQGIDGKARYQGTAIEECLPVMLQTHDDRVEKPEGCVPAVTDPDHSILKGIPARWPAFLGYNRITAKDGSQTLLTVGDDPFLVVGKYGKGRTGAFASDCSPHWAPEEFVNWAYYDAFWAQLAGWLAGGKS